MNLGARAIAVRAAGDEVAEETDVVDVNGVLLEWMARYGEPAVVLRPDRFALGTDALTRLPDVLETRDVLATQVSGFTAAAHP